MQHRIVSCCYISSWKTVNFQSRHFYHPLSDYEDIGFLCSILHPFLYYNYHSCSLRWDFVAPSIELIFLSLWYGTGHMTVFGLCNISRCTTNRGPNVLAWFGLAFCTSAITIRRIWPKMLLVRMTGGTSRAGTQPSWPIGSWTRKINVCCNHWNVWGCLLCSIIAMIAPPILY